MSTPSPSRASRRARSTCRSISARRAAASSISSASPTRRLRKARSACARPWARSGWRCRTAASPSISRRPICRKREALRPSHRARPSRGDGRAAGERDGELRRDGRTVARRAGHRGCGRAARGDRRVGTAARSDLSRCLRRRSGVGGRHRDRRHAVPDRARQSHEGHASAGSSNRQACRRCEGDPGPQGRERPGDRQACARDRRARADTTCS